MQSNQNKFLAEAEKEIANGNLWRAKEILHRQIKYSAYDIQLFEKLGLVLLEMNDLAEAGKYIFLSGIRKPEYGKAIDIFLQKYEDKPHNLFHPFPRSAKLSKISDYPKSVQEKLREIGFVDELTSIHGIQENSGVSTYKDKLALTIFLTFILGIIILIVLGVVKLFEIIF